MHILKNNKRTSCSCPSGWKTSHASALHMVLSLSWLLPSLSLSHHGDLVPELALLINLFILLFPFSLCVENFSCFYICFFNLETLCMSCIVTSLPVFSTWDSTMLVEVIYVFISTAYNIPLYVNISMLLSVLLLMRSWIVWCTYGRVILGYKSSSRLSVS